MPRPRQKHEQPLAFRNPEFRPERRHLGRRRLRLRRHRMPDEVAGHPRRLHVGRLERQERQHMVHDPRHPRRPPRPPSPHRRRHIMDHLQPRPQSPRPLRHPQRKIRTVDSDKRIRRHRRRRISGFPDAAQETGNPRNYLRQAHDRQLFHREATGQPFGRHRRPADAVEDQPRAAELAQAGDQRPAQQVPRRLARDHEKARPVRHALARRTRGSIRSRSPSPIRFRPRTVSTIARPGTSARWGAREIIVWLSASIRPQDGIGGCAPSPT